MAKRLHPTDPKVVTFKPDRETHGYGVCDCSWEEEVRTQSISLEAAERFAEGWKAVFEVEAAW